MTGAGVVIPKRYQQSLTLTLLSRPEYLGKVRGAVCRAALHRILGHRRTASVSLQRTAGAEKDVRCPRIKRNSATRSGRCSGQGRNLQWGRLPRAVFRDERQVTTFRRRSLSNRPFYLRLLTTYGPAQIPSEFSCRSSPFWPMVASVLPTSAKAHRSGHTDRYQHRPEPSEKR